jgi:hypothetical protein
MELLCISYRPVYSRPLLFELIFLIILSKTKTPWSESASELYRPSDRRLLEK